MENLRCDLDYLSVLAGMSMMVEPTFIASFLHKDGPGPMQKSYMQISVYFMEKHDIPKSEAEYDDLAFIRVYDAFVERFVSYHRFMLQSHVNKIDAEARMERHKHEEAIRLAKATANKMFLQNCNNNYGDKTVAQITTELGISKSEVRRRKSEGTL